MAWSLQGNGQPASGSGAGVTQITLASADAPAGAGDLLWLGVCIRDSATIEVDSVSDSVGNVWSRVFRFATAGQGVEVWVASANGAGDLSIGVTFTASCLHHLHAGVFTGGPASWAVTATNSSSASATTTHPAGELTGQDGELLIAVSSVGTGFTVSSSASDYVNLTLSARAFSQYAVLTGPLTSDAAWISTDAVSTVSAHVRVGESAAFQPAWTGSATHRIGASLP